MLTDRQGNPTTTYAYSPFGETDTTVQQSDNPTQYTGREHDGTGLYYYRARYYAPDLARFVSSDPIGLEGGWNTYAYVLNNPLRYVDPTGLDVTITINRTTYTPNSIIGTINVTSTVTNSTFSGSTLENRTPTNPNLPVPPGTYPSSVRTDRTPNRIELNNVPNASNVQIHVGNTRANVNGCFAAGTSTATDFVGNSVNAINSINNIITLDGSGNITVIVNGSATGP